MTIPLNKPVICPALIGRTADLAALRLLIEQTKSGKGQFALLCGEAGIGKSRLVAELKITATDQGFQILQGNCFPADPSCPYAPLLDLLRSVFFYTPGGRLGSSVTPFARELIALLPEITQIFPEIATLPPLPLLDPEQEKRRLFAALTHFFLHQAVTHPLLLIMEDVHWSDDTSMEFLHYLARHSARQSLLVLLTYRSDELSPSLKHWLAQLDREHLGQEVVLTHLTRSDTDAMLRAIFDLQRPVQAEMLDAIYGLTEGNPFFIEEILKSLAAGGEIFHAHEAWDRKPLDKLHVPRSIQDAVQQRSDRLSLSARQVLILAAVAGRRFDFVVLQQLTSYDEQHLLTLMKELIAAQLVIEESAERFAFRHALTRQAIYIQLLVRERKALHHSIAETMERLYATTLESHLADLAYHFYEAGLWEKTLEYGQQAGERARRLYASHAVIEEYTRTLDAARHLALVPSSMMYRARGQAYETLGNFEQARHDYEQSLEVAHEAHNGEAEWQSIIDIGFLWAARDYEQTGFYFRRAIELARELDDSKMLAHSLNRLGNWHLNIEQPHEALSCHQEALTIFQEMHDQSGVAETLDLLGLTSYMGGDMIQCKVYYEQAIVLFRAMDNRQGLIISLTLLMICRGNYLTDTMVSIAMSLPEVMRQGEMALKIAHEIGQRSDEALVLFSWGLCLGLRGDYLHALDAVQKSLEISEEIEHRQWITAAYWSLGALYKDLLALPQARQYLEQALAVANEIGSLLWVLLATGHLASTYILQHELVQAEFILDAAAGPQMPAQTMAQRLIWRTRIELALAHSDPKRAILILDQMMASAVNVASEQDIPLLAKLRGEALMMLHQLAEAETALQVAQTGATIRGVRPLLWRISIDLGKLYRTQRRYKEAQFAFTNAQELLEELAGSIADTTLHDHFLHQAIALLPRQEPIASRRSAKRAIGGLTRREREVATLIAQGKTNREIADILVVNYRTIEKHVENVLSKLGFVSRVQIAVWASEKGWGEKRNANLPRRNLRVVC